MSQIENILREDRSFPPSDTFRAAARVGSEAEYEALWKRSIDDPDGFWGEIAKELPWMKPFDSVLDWSDAPRASWFSGGRLNASAVCLDQPLATARRDKLAIVFEGEPGDQVTYTYAELHTAVSRFANVLRARGIQKGDRVAIYMPMIPELVMAVLACARIGAIHSVIFGGFSASSIRDRVEDGACSAVICADGGWRRGKVLPLKDVVDEALAELSPKQAKKVHTVLCVRRCANDVAWTEGRDVWYHEALESVADDCLPEPMESEDTLFLLYTSGSTCKRKGFQHTSCGYMVGTILAPQDGLGQMGECGRAAGGVRGYVAGGAVAI
ncbi:MAG: AMP-binding protein, partial [Planctomycetes bacterium]|nr:AMP-binding protein [Planctomycetota bacterium]